MSDQQASPRRPEAETRIERWLDRMGDRCFYLAAMIGFLMIDLFLLKSIGVLPELMAKAIELLGLAIIFPLLLSPLWLTGRGAQRRTWIGQFFSAWFNDDRAGALLRKLAGLAFACLFFSAIDFAPQFMFAVSSTLALGMTTILAIKTFATPADLPVEREDVDPPPKFSFNPGVPGQRKWRANVYGENAYAILGVAQDATAEAIRAAFKTLVQQYHPHSVPPEQKEQATILFVRIDQAYELLSNRANRARYDAWIEHLDGDEPTLDKASELFRDPDGCAELDEMFGCGEATPEETFEQAHSQEEPAPASPPEMSPDRTEDDQGAEVKEPTAPVDVQIPDSVREAMGLPPRPRTDEE